MKIVNKYILRKFIETFNPIFFTLFFMISIVYMIKFAELTAIIQVTFLELGKLYIYMMPRIIIYILPIIFFIAIAITMTKMSKDNEMSVIFSFGVSPKKVTKLFFVLSLSVSVFLVFNTIFLVPISVQLFKNFVDIKKTKAQFNIKPSEFGQKFSNWFVFINKSDNKKNFQNIVMYSNKNGKEQFVIAKNANINNDKGLLNLNLHNGKAYTIKKENIMQTDYKALKIYNKQNINIIGNNGIFSYWLQGLKDKGRAKDFALFMLLSLFPLFAYLLSFSIGIFNPRYEKSNVYLYIFLTILSYYIIMKYTLAINPILSLIADPLAILIASMIFFKRRILRRY